MGCVWCKPSAIEDSPKERLSSKPPLSIEFQDQLVLLLEEKSLLGQRNGLMLLV